MTEGPVFWFAKESTTLAREPVASMHAIMLTDLVAGDHLAAACLSAEADIYEARFLGFQRIKDNEPGVPIWAVNGHNYSFKVTAWAPLHQWHEARVTKVADGPSAEECADEALGEIEKTLRALG